MKSTVIWVRRVVRRSILSKSRILKVLHNVSKFREILGIESYLFYISEKMKASPVHIDKNERFGKSTKTAEILRE